MVIIIIIMVMVVMVVMVIDKPHNYIVWISSI